MTGIPEGAVLIRASTVAWCGRGLVIMGRSGSGKSALALQLMALGCDLVSDDQTLLRAGEGQLLAQAPEPIRGRIEARGVGILAAEATVARIVLAADLDHVETERLPPERTTMLAGHILPLVHRLESAHFPAAILQYLKSGRVA